MLTWMLLDWQADSGQPSPHEALQLAAQPQGGDFTLRSTAGPMSLKDFRGKVVLLYFGYTWCPDICPLNLAYLQMALDALKPAEQAQVQVIFVSVDPQRDTPRRLAEYTAHFSPKFLGITGAPEDVAEVASLYGAAYRRGEEGEGNLDYSVDHSADTYLIDRNGRLAQILSHATPPNRIAAAVLSQLDTGESE